jgi:hypothetical protein
MTSKKKEVLYLLVNVAFRMRRRYFGEQAGGFQVRPVEDAL